MQVTVQFQEPRKPHAWKKAFTAKVLFADKRAILVRGGGSHSMFDGKGHFRFMSYSKRLVESGVIPGYPRYANGWRIAPESLERLKAGVV